MLLFDEHLAVKIGIIPAVIYQAGIQLQSASAIEVEGKQCLNVKAATWLKMMPFITMMQLKESFKRLSEEGYVEKKEVFYMFKEPEVAIVTRGTPKIGSAIDELSDLQKERFKRFWEAYPKKVGFGAAIKSWKKVSPDKTLTESILEAVKMSLEIESWKSGFIPLPSTWLNQERWNDVVTKETDIAYITDGMTDEERQKYKEEYGL